MRLNQVTEIKTINETDPERAKEILSEEIFSDEDARSEFRIKMVKQPHLVDRFTDFLVSETEAKRLLSGWLLFLLLLFFIVLVI